MRWLYKFRAWRMQRKHPPVIGICTSGDATPAPQVHVYAAGVRGLQTVYSWPADRVGHARAQLYGRGLADIMGCKLIDERGAHRGD